MDRNVNLWLMDRNVYTFGCYDGHKFRYDNHYPCVSQYAEYLRFSWPEPWTSLARRCFQLVLTLVFMIVQASIPAVKKHLKPLRRMMFRTYSKRCQSVADANHVAANIITDKNEIQAFSTNLDRVLEVCNLARQLESGKVRHGEISETEYRMGWDRLLVEFFGQSSNSSSSSYKRMIVTSRCACIFSLA